jgi:small subunit ribosomal protein S7
MEVTPARQISLAMRWIVQYADGRAACRWPTRWRKNSKTPRRPGQRDQKRDDTHKMAQANRAFAHFRW